VLQKMGQNPTPAQLAIMIAEVDDNNDGEVDFQEFLHM
jgi:Ca2+-binding EF-hand superfamily protein